MESSRRNESDIMIRILEYKYSLSSMNRNILNVIKELSRFNNEIKNIRKVDNKKRNVTLDFRDDTIVQINIDRKGIEVIAPSEDSKNYFVNAILKSHPEYKEYIL